jgi:non-ribosomal peptide synthetase component E (peptide arylation enzyme)
MTKLAGLKNGEFGNYLESGYWTKELTVDYWQRNALEMPDQEAIFDGGVRLNWRQASEYVDRLIIGLKGYGLDQNDVLLVQAQNSVWLALLRLACEKAGIILTFLHYGFRRNEIEHVIEITRPVGAIIPGTTEKFDFHGLYQDLQNRYGALKILLKIDELGSAKLPSVQQLVERSKLDEQLPVSPASREFLPGDFTSIVTSSGTTGAPKCVEFSSIPRLASGRVYIERLKLTQKDKVASFMPLFTGPGDLLFHTAPQIGAAQILLDSFTPEAAFWLIDQERPSGLVLVPTMLTRMLNYPGLDEFDCSSLRFITSGGSVLPYEVAKQAEQRLGAHIVQGYGLMDYGALASHSLDDPQELRWTTNGKPLTGTEVVVLDQHGNSVENGQIGEITARGPHCIGSYVGNPKLTEEVWKDGYFHTGDLGRVDPDGHLKIIGRSKDIIIRGGQNISATEIEGVLAQHPNIAEASAVKMPDPDLGERVCVFVVTASKKPFSFGDMVKFMQDHGVAKFKIPERLELVDELPLTPGGTKVNKSKLEEMISREYNG